jgi:hypothetical protein
MPWIWLMWGCAPKSPSAAGSCAPPTADGWASCVGQEVVFDGKIPIQVMDHPLVGGPGAYQGYVDVAGVGQIVMLPSSDPGCAAGVPVSVRGTLRRIELGGPEGTRSSYRGWSVDGASVTCR